MIHSFYYDLQLALIFYYFHALCRFLEISTVIFTGYPGISCLLDYDENMKSFIQFFKQFLGFFSGFAQS